MGPLQELLYGGHGRDRTHKRVGSRTECAGQAAARGQAVVLKILAGAKKDEGRAVVHGAGIGRIQISAVL